MGQGPIDPTDHKVETKARDSDHELESCTGQWSCTDHELDTFAKDLGPTDHQLQT